MLIESNVYNFFLNNIATFAYFNLQGKIPDDNNLLQMSFNGELINGELTSKLLTEISSYP
jgi:hypothetical protein